MAYLELRNIGKIYASEGGISVGIRKVSLAFDKGEFVAITGKSGAGKTTLLNIIGGMETYEEGEMYLDGAPTSPYTLREWEAYQAENISYIFQNYNILDSFTVLENVEFALLTIEDLKVRRAKALEIIERVGLKDRAHMRGSQLSGGEKQRTVIARAIAKDSPIILADEPTGNLDSKTAKDILELLHEISKGKLVIVVTHSYEDLQQYATRHIRIYDGEVESDEILSGEKAQFALKDGEADFAVEHQIIFKQKEKKQKSDKKGKRIRDAFLLGFKRFVSRPKQAALMSSVLTVAMICIICVIGFISPQGWDGNRQGIKINPIPGRVMVADRDGTGYTQAEASELVAKYGATTYIWNDYYLDAPLDLDLSTSPYESNHASVYTQIVEPGKTRVQQGKVPEAVGEIAICIPYSYRGDWKIGDSVILGTAYSYTPGYSSLYITCKLVGLSFYVDNRQNPQIQMTQETYNAISLYRRQEFQIQWTGKDDEQQGNEMSQSVKVDLDYTLPQGKCILRHGEAADLEGVTVRLLAFGQDLGVNITETVKVPGWNDGYRVTIAGDLVTDKMPLESTQQISLVFADNATARQQMRQMEADGLRVLLAKDVQIREQQTQDIMEILESLTQALFTMLIALVVAGMVVLTLAKLILATKGDIAIFRTMGIQEKVVKTSTYVQLLCALVPAGVLSVIATMIIYFTSLGKNFTFIGFTGGLVLILALGLILWLIGLSYNKLLYSTRVKKGLRRVNK